MTILRLGRCKSLSHEVMTTVDAVMRWELIVDHAATQLDFTSICGLKHGLHRILRRKTVDDWDRVIGSA